KGVSNAPPGSDIWKLLLTMALNKIRAQAIFHHAAKRDVRLTRRLDVSAERQLHTREDDLTDTLLQMALEERLGQLPAHHRTVVELRLQGYEVEAIVQKTGRSKRTVERCLQQALIQLKTLFDKDQ